jgi:molecular chaperone DnaK
LIEARNTADNSIYAAEKVLSELGEKVPAEVKTDVQVAVAEVKKIKESDDEPAIRKTVDALSQAVQKIGTVAYQQAQDQPKPEDGPQNPNGEKAAESEEKGSE